MRKPAHLLTFLIVLLTAVSCKPRLTYSEFVPVSGSSWHLKDTLSFHPVIEDTTLTYQVSLFVRHGKNYAFSNLWVKATMPLPSGRDTSMLVQFKLADKTGAWLGKCSNSYCLQEYVLQNGMDFPVPRSYKYSVMQYMRTEELQDVKAMGLVISESADTKE